MILPYLTSSHILVIQYYPVTVVASLLADNWTPCAHTCISHKIKTMFKLDSSTDFDEDDGTELILFSSSDENGQQVNIGLCIWTHLHPCQPVHFQLHLSNWHFLQLLLLPLTPTLPLPLSLLVLAPQLLPVLPLCSPPCRGVVHFQLSPLIKIPCGKTSGLLNLDLTQVFSLWQVLQMMHMLL